MKNFVLSLLLLAAGPVAFAVAQQMGGYSSGEYRPDPQRIQQRNDSLFQPAQYQPQPAQYQLPAAPAAYGYATTDGRGYVQNEYVQKMEVPGSVKIIPVTNRPAEGILVVLRQVFPELNNSQQTIRMAADSHTNSLVLITAYPEVTQSIEELVQKLDKPAWEEKKGQEECVAVCPDVHVPTTPQRAKGGNETYRMYYVGDLLLANLPDQPVHSPDLVVKGDWDKIINLITTVTGGTEGWADPSTEPMPYQPNLSLVIRQTEDVHDDVSSLLKQLRALHESKVAVDVPAVQR